MPPRLAALLRPASLALPLAFVSLPALAHPGHDATSGLAAGLAHPLGGIDHLLAMLAVGLVASGMGRNGVWAVPGAFVAAMLAGGAAAMLGVAPPAIELGIVVSLLAFGALLATGTRQRLAPVLAAAAVFGWFHGAAHGAELPVGASAPLYALGFALATIALHAGGIALARTLERKQGRLAPALLRVSGLAIVCAGVVLLLG